MSNRNSKKSQQNQGLGAIYMLSKVHEKQQGMELVILEQLVPQNHLLRRMDQSIDFSFIHRLCEPLYCADNGRPAIERKSFSACYLLAIYMAYARSVGWKKKSTTTWHTNGFVV